MTPMSDGETAILGKLAEVAQQQAVTTERLIGVLERFDDHLKRADEDRDAAVESLKRHFNAGITSSDTWWRRAFLIAVALLMLSNLVGVALDRYWTLLKPS